MKIDESSQINPMPDGINENFEYHELHSAIRQCKKDTAPGEDDITYEMLKHFPKSSLLPVLKFYNKIWNVGKIPQDWKHSIVLPLFKNGKDPTTPDSYRPIALTAALCKIMERLIANRLNWYLEKNHLFNKNQSGFRKNKSTIDQIMRLQNEIQNSINHNECTVGVFLDFNKAYDMLWREGLLYKISKLNISGNMYHWIKDFLTDRTFQVKVGNSLSSRFKLEHGTPQGSVISPLLFLLMINDFPETTENVKNAIFADDCSIWKSGRDENILITNLQKNLDNIFKWCEMWGFSLSKDKTIAVLFSNKTAINKKGLHISGSQIAWKSEVKFLGIIFDEKLSWVNHINYIVEKCKRRLNLMRCISGSSWGLGSQ